MTYRGRIRNGVVVFDEPVPWKEGTEVEVGPVDSSPEGQTLGQKLMKYAGKAKGLPPDMAEHHDHYLYGTPKK